MKAKGFRRSFRSAGSSQSKGMGVSVRRRHSFDQYVNELRELPAGRKRVSEIRGKWASTPQLQNSGTRCDAAIQVIGMTGRSLSADEGGKSGGYQTDRADDEASSNRNPDETTEEEEEDQQTSLSRVSSSGFIAMCNSQRLDVRGRFEGWELKRSEIQLRHRLGQGDGGVIHFAKWRGLKCVAKMLRTESDHGERPRISPAVARQDLVNEITVLSHLRHPNLVLFLGACSKGEPLIILNEFLPGGNLEEFIHRTWLAKAQWRPSPSQVLQWGIELARALSFLHNCTTPIVHRDLKPANLLLDADLHLKVCDFGLSKLRELRCCSGSYQTGSLRYMAPEVFKHDPSYDEKVDMYSAGMILWFMATGVRPFDRTSASSVARKAARDGLRPDLQPVQDKHSSALAAVVQRCWAHEPQDRPSAMQLVRDLELQHSYLETMQAEGAALPVAIKLEAHAFFHQALVGPCTVAQPGMWRMGRFGERAKWKAWRKLEDMRRDVALDHLNLLLDDCCPAWRTKSHRTITTGPDGDRHADPSLSRLHAEPLERAPSAGGADAHVKRQRSASVGRKEGEEREDVASAHSAQTTTSAKSTANQPHNLISSREDSSVGGHETGDSEDSRDQAFASPEPSGSRSVDSSSSEVQEKDIAKVAAMLDAVEKEAKKSQGGAAGGGGASAEGMGAAGDVSSSKSLPLPLVGTPSRLSSAAASTSSASKKGRNRLLGGGWGAMAR